MTTISQQPNVKNCQPALDFTRPFMDDKTLSISALHLPEAQPGPSRVKNVRLSIDHRTLLSSR
jgi:hypothetical protein